ncbi:MAG: DNA adenine methylase [Candidatus Aerophobetes bacterium]|nr:DNA adenine methylase [Candidatus Aerophobetes bacterium]
MKQKKVSFIRYPGGKQRILNYIIPFLPSRELIKGRFIEPFLGGGAVFFALNPDRALLADINPELIDLYRGIRRSPLKVW